MCCFAQNPGATHWPPKHGYHAGSHRPSLIGAGPLNKPLNPRAAESGRSTHKSLCPPLSELDRCHFWGFFECETKREDTWSLSLHICSIILYGHTPLEIIYWPRPASTPHPKPLVNTSNNGWGSLNNLCGSDSGGDFRLDFTVALPLLHNEKGCNSKSHDYQSWG
jgi:hypothetical protein